MNDKPGKYKIIDEIEELCNIPGIDDFFYRALAEARVKFKDKIHHYRKRVVPSFKAGESKDKAYFFDLNRVDDPESETGHKWELGEFKLESRQDIIEVILPRFIRKVDDYEILPQQEQNRIISSPNLDKSFKITFMKNNDKRVIGFVEEVEEAEENKDKYVASKIGEHVVKDKGGMVRVSVKHPDLYKEDIDKKISSLMEEDENVKNDIIFYYLMMQKSKEKSPG